MDVQLADSIGRQLAWAICLQEGIVDRSMAKEAGLLEGIIFAPLTAIAALLSAPFGSKMRSMGMGLLLGAGVGALSDREVENKNQQGEQVNHHSMSPAVRAILAGISLGGSARVRSDVEHGRPVSQASAILTGAPLGAMMSSSPASGLVIGTVSGDIISALTRSGQNPLQALLPMGLPRGKVQSATPSNISSLI